MREGISGSRRQGGQDPAPRRPGIPGEIPEEARAGDCSLPAGLMGLAPLGAGGNSERVCARERRAEAQARCSPVCGPAPGAPCSLWSRWQHQHGAAARPSAERSHHPPPPGERPGCGGPRGALQPPLARSADLPRLPPKNVSQVQGDPLLVLSSRGTAGSLQNQGEGMWTKIIGGSGISPMT